MRVFGIVFQGQTSSTKDNILSDFLRRVGVKRHVYLLRKITSFMNCLKVYIRLLRYNISIIKNAVKIPIGGDKEKR